MWQEFYIQIKSDKMDYNITKAPNILEISKLMYMKEETSTHQSSYEHLHQIPFCLFNLFNVQQGFSYFDPLETAPAVPQWACKPLYPTGSPVGRGGDLSKLGQDWQMWVF